MRRSRVIGITLASTVLMPVALALADPASAQATTSSPASGTAEAPEIIITAQRRSQNAQNVAIAITALSGDALEDKKVVRELDLQNVAPGLSITKAGSTESINIRGIGLASASAQVTNGVATYLDGVFQPPTIAAAEFYDMGSVEVLRGPQGTLVGANSTGGAVYLNTTKPVLGQFSGDVSAWGGSYSHFGASAVLNIPLSDSLALRIAGLADRRDSYYRNLGPSDASPDRLAEHDGRVQVLWKPGTHFQATAKVELINRQGGGFAYQPISVAPLQYAAGATGIPWTVSYDSPTSNYERATLTSLEMKYIFDGGLTIRSLTGYLNKRFNDLYDYDGASLPINPATPQSTLNQFVREREYSQEINIISPDTGAFRYVVGGYAQRNKIGVLIDDATVSTVGGPPSDILIEPYTSKTLLGLFGQATYQLSDKFNVEAGLRYSHFHVAGSGGIYVALPAVVCAGFLHDAYVAGLGCDVAPQTGTEGDGRATGKFGINFKPDQDNLFYAFVARGYKNGGINPPGGQFLPETVWDYEGGWKSSFLNRHIRTQIGAFYNSYKNFQEDVTNPFSGASGVTNLANAKIYGFEGSAQAKLGQLSIDGGLAYTHSSVSAFTAINSELTPAGVAVPQCSPAGVSGTSGVQCFNYYYFTNSGGKPNLYSPKLTWNVNAEYKIRFSDDLTATPRIGYSHVGSQWDYVTYNSAIDLIKAHNLLNAGVTLQYRDIKVELYGTNLANKYYVSGRFSNALFFGAPREFGAKISVGF